MLRLLFNLFIYIILVVGSDGIVCHPSIFLLVSSSVVPNRTHVLLLLFKIPVGVLANAWVDGRSTSTAFARDPHPRPRRAPDRSGP